MTESLPGTPSLKNSARTVQDALDAAGVACEVREFPASTRTAAEAAAAIGCEVAQIAKSIVFRSASSDRAVMVVAMGTHRVDEKKVKALVGEKIRKADAEFVRRTIGFAIGGVPPCGHATEVMILLDQGLQSFEVLWAAAGTPNAVFKLSPDELQTLTGASFVDVSVDVVEKSGSRGDQ